MPMSAPALAHNDVDADDVEYRSNDNANEI